MTERTSQDVLSMLKRKTDRQGNLKEPLTTIENFLIVLRNDPFFSNVRFNLMRSHPEISIDGKTQLWTETDDSIMFNHIETEYGFKNETNNQHAFKIFCAEREYNPVLERIEAIQWDGQKRCESFLVKYMGADDTPYNRECSRMLFACGTHRYVNPGCKVDFVPVFMGDQGGGKTTVCQWLALEPKFYTSAKTISGKAGIESIDGKWIVELEELLAVLANDRAGQKVEEAAKAFLTTQSDFYRKPYGHRPQDYPRYCIFIGTTNRDTFLTDKTGNRRWYPIRCNPSADYLYAHKEEVQAEIEQCWAEMLAAYRANAPISRATPNAHLLQEIKAEQREAEVEDYRAGLIEEYIRDKKRVCILDLWRNCLHDRSVTVPDMQRRDSVEIGEILTNQLKWERGKSVKNYYR